jgi:hypothetical protein
MRSCCYSENEGAPPSKSGERPVILLHYIEHPRRKPLFYAGIKVHRFLGRFSFGEFARQQDMPWAQRPALRYAPGL